MEVKVWDSWDQEITETVDPWESWDKVQECNGLPGGLIAFLQTSTDHTGCGFEQPTTVQAYSWPTLQSGKDLVGVAKTGSGKTLAFLLPGFIKVRKLKKTEEIDVSKGPGLLVLTPTRELCMQILSDTQKFGKPVKLTAACAYGGAKAADQEWEIKQGPDCLIATPGRLNNFVNNQVVSLEQCRYAVLDEADRMLDMGFEPQIRTIMDLVPESRQTAMFTATWPSTCKDLSKRYTRDPLQIQIGGDDLTVCEDVEQHTEVCAGNPEKIEALKRILTNMWEGNCLVFCNSKKNCRDLSWTLNADEELKMPAAELHGDLDQKDRDKALNQLRSSEVRVLVATDLASRGLDVRNVGVVVNFDCPKSSEDYVHRIGRTGRAGDKGKAYTFLSSWGDEDKAKFIVANMEKVRQRPPKDLKDIAAQESSKENWKKDEGNKEDEWWKKDEKKEEEWWKKEEKKEDEWWKKEEKKEDEWWKKEEKKEEGWKKEEKKEEWWKKEEKKEDEGWPPRPVAAVKKKEDERWKEEKKEDEWWKEEKKEEKWKTAEKVVDDWWKTEEKKDGGKKEEAKEEQKKEDAWETDDKKADDSKKTDEKDEDQANEEEKNEEFKDLLQDPEQEQDGASKNEEPSKQADEESKNEDDWKDWFKDDADGDAEKKDDSAGGGAMEVEEEAQASPAILSPASPKKRAAPEEDPAAPASPKKRAATEASAAAPAKKPGPLAGFKASKALKTATTEDVGTAVANGKGSSLKVSDLKEWLEKRGLPTTGVKAMLIERVQEQLAEEKGGAK